MDSLETAGRVLAVNCSASHTFSKPGQASIRLIAGVGVEGDAHSGATVQHRSRVARDPSQPNLRQVHLIHSELFEELRAKGFTVRPGDMGENITTVDVPLLELRTGTLLLIGTALIAVTGLRNPCSQLDDLQPGLMAAVLDRTPDGELVRKAGVMAVVLESGHVRAGDAIHVSMPPGPGSPLQPV